MKPSMKQVLVALTTKFPYKDRSESALLAAALTDFDQYRSNERYSSPAIMGFIMLAGVSLAGRVKGALEGDPQDKQDMMLLAPLLIGLELGTEFSNPGAVIDDVVATIRSKL